MTVTYAEALDALRARMGHKAVKHCERTSESAAALASRYGVDVEEARLAGLLHDWDREKSAAELFADAHRYDIDITPADEAAPRLLHARTGACAVAEALPGVSAAVIDAIARHTVGDIAMTPLDMVVYLADMIEEHRDYPGVDELRSAVGVVSLPELFALGYRQSVLHLVQARRRIHPTTIDVWNTYVAGEVR